MNDAGSMNITLGHLVAIAAIGGFLLMLLTAASTLLTKWIESKLPAPKLDKEQRQSMVLEQAQACKYDHQGIKEILLGMNANIAAAVAALNAMANADALRHQKILEHLRALRRKAGHTHAEIGDIDDE
jgi:prenyltransferase beta subunit